MLRSNASFLCGTTPLPDCAYGTSWSCFLEEFSSSGAALQEAAPILFEFEIKAPPLRARAKVSCQRRLSFECSFIWRHAPSNCPGVLAGGRRHFELPASLKRCPSAKQEGLAGSRTARARGQRLRDKGRGKGAPPLPPRWWRSVAHRRAARAHKRQ